MGLVPVGRRESYASAAAGAIAQNVDLFAAGNGLATVIRAPPNSSKALAIPARATMLLQSSSIALNKPRWLLKPVAKEHLRPTNPGK